MKFNFKIGVAAILAFFQTPLIAQTLIVNPNAEGGFENGTTFAANGWTLVNNSSANTGNNWYLSNNTLTNGNYNFSPTGNRVAYISQSNNGNWIYNFNQSSTTHFYRDVTFPAGQTDIKLKFRWNAYGEGPTYDVIYVFIAPTTLTPIVGQPTGTNNNTNNWTGTGTSDLRATLHSSTNILSNTANITLPASYAGTTKRLIFTWKNGSTLGSNPPAAIDSIYLFADCPKATVSLINQSAACSNNINILANVNNAVSSGTFKWYVNNTLISSQTSNVFNSNTIASGSTVKCVYNMNNACAYKDSAQVVVNFGVNNNSTEYLTFCSKDLPKVWRGITIPSNAISNAQYATVNVPTSNGCDSIITLNLSVNPTPAPKTEYISTCRGLLNQITWRGIAIPTTAQSNNKYDSVLVASPNGCDSLIYLDLNVIETASLIKKTINDCKPVVFNGKSYAQSTIIYDTIKSVSMCDSIINETTITIVPFEIDLKLKNPQQYLVGDNITLEAQANTFEMEVISWNPSYLFPNQMGLIKEIPGPENEIISVIAKSNLGCLDTAYLNVKATQLYKDVILPNAFTPNGDGKNDIFQPVFNPKNNYTVSVFEIYNRWGEKVYGSFSGSNNLGWDGYYKGKMADKGVYFYRINITYMDKSTKTITGEVHLIR